MALHNVPIEAPVHEHATLHVHLIAHLEQAQVATVECFLDCGDGVGAIARQFHYREAHPVVRVICNNYN